MENLPFSNANAGMAALMTLVAIMTTKVLYFALMVNSDFIDRKETKARTRKS